MRFALLLAACLIAVGAHAAEPIRIGITTILSGPLADRGQSEQYGAQLALDEINEAGGVLGRPLEAYYADNACQPQIGVPATNRLLEEEHVPVVIGALCTPVTHAIMPMMQDAKVPLVIATSAGQDFVDASGAGGNDYAFKTIPSEVDIGRGLFAYLTSQKVKSVAIVTDTGGFFEANGKAWAKLAPASGMTVTEQEVLPASGTDFAALIAKLKAGAPDAVLVMFGPSTGPFFKAYEASGWRTRISGRFDLAAAENAVSPSFRGGEAMADVTSVAVFSTADDRPGVQDFVRAYHARYGINPTQRPFFVYEAVKLVADAIRRAGSDQPAPIEAALKTSAMPSLVGGDYKLDDHNHPRLPILVLALRDGKPAVIARE